MGIIIIIIIIILLFKRLPTYHYGHEPSNKFATYHAKFFSNAVREDDIIQIANGGIFFFLGPFISTTNLIFNFIGILYTPGSAGTRQEIFQDACKNHYAKQSNPVSQKKKKKKKKKKESVKILYIFFPP